MDPCALGSFTYSAIVELQNGLDRCFHALIILTKTFV